MRDLKKGIALLLCLVLTVALFAACGPTTPTDPTKAPDTEEKATTPPADDKTPEENVETADGKAFAPMPTDSRNKEKYIYAQNLTPLPLVGPDDTPVTIEIWRELNSTIMSKYEEALYYQEAQKVTGVNLTFIYPPVGQKRDNFNLLVATNELPHIFSEPDEYAGGHAKAIEDEVYVELTPYYDRGLMPNLKYLRDSNEQFFRDTSDDLKRIIGFPQFDIVPSHPWSGMWIRMDVLKKVNLEAPTTIDEWHTFLVAAKDAGYIPLATRCGSNDLGFWDTNKNFASAYDVAIGWFNKDGQAKYGPVEPGYKDFVTLMHDWYAEGLINQDFATIDSDGYNALVASAKTASNMMNYGEYGQAKRTGQTNDPDFDLRAVPAPSLTKGQQLHIRQDNSIVRGLSEFMTPRAIEDGIDETVVLFMDWWYSQQGGDVGSYGIEGVSYEWGADGEYKWIYPDLGKDAGMDFWTLFPIFKRHNGAYLRNSMAYENQPEVIECIEVWATTGSDWTWPDNTLATPEEATEVANIMTDIDAYRNEMTQKFIMGTEPLSNFDAFVAKIHEMGIDRAMELRQARLDRFFAR